MTAVAFTMLYYVCFSHCFDEYVSFSGMYETNRVNHATHTTVYIRDATHAFRRPLYGAAVLRFHVTVHTQQKQISPMKNPQRTVQTDSLLWHDADCACTSWAWHVCQRCCLSSCPSVKRNIKKRAPVPEIVKTDSERWADCVLSIIYEACPHSVLGSHAPFPVTLLYTRRSSPAVCSRIFRSILPIGHVMFLTHCACAIVNVLHSPLARFLHLNTSFI